MPILLLTGSDFFLSGASLLSAKRHSEKSTLLILTEELVWPMSIESLAVSWLFPGKTVQIDAPCLDCGSPIRVEMKDGVVQNAEPAGIMAYTSVPFRKWFNDLPYA